MKSIKYTYVYFVVISNEKDISGRVECECLDLLLKWHFHGPRLAIKIINNESRVWYENYLIYHKNKWVNFDMLDPWKIFLLTRVKVMTRKFDLLSFGTQWKLSIFGTTILLSVSFRSIIAVSIDSIVNCIQCLLTPLTLVTCSVTNFWTGSFVVMFSAALNTLFLSLFAYGISLTLFPDFQTSI